VIEKQTITEDDEEEVFEIALPLIKEFEGLRCEAY
jgi:GH24 family phage-related lysozyme (muramidase)